MVALQIRDVPDDLRDRLSELAASAGSRSGRTGSM
jgi:hypothetical protein